MLSNELSNLEVVSRDVGLTSKLSYDVVMHTAPGNCCGNIRLTMP